MCDKTKELAQARKELARTREDLANFIEILAEYQIARDDADGAMVMIEEEIEICRECIEEQESEIEEAKNDHNPT